MSVANENRFNRIIYTLFFVLMIALVPAFAGQDNKNIQSLKGDGTAIYKPDPAIYGTHNTIVINTKNSEKK